MANFELKVGKFGIKYGADLPIVKNEGVVKSTSYTVGNSPLDFLNQQYSSSSFADYFYINSNKNIIRAIDQCPQVSTILFRKGQQIANGITTVKKANGKPAVSEDAKRIQKLIDRPNVFQNRAQYVAVMEMYLNSWGWIAEYKEVVTGFGIVSRRLLKPECCDIKWKKTTMFFVSDKSTLIESFKYTENGITTTITDFENIYFYTAPNFQSVNGYLPESPLRTLENPINSSIKNYKSRIRSVGSPWGFLSRQANDKISDIPMKESEKREFLDNYKNNYGVEDNQSAVAFANAPIQFNAVMPPVAALQLLELLKSDSATICDVLGYEFDLLGRDLGGVANNNKTQAGKNQYQNHTIPAAKNRDEQEIESLELENYGLLVETDFSHVACLQEDLKAKSEELRNNVQSLIQGFKNNLFNYDDMVMRAGVSESNTKWTGKWWFDFTPEEKAFFESQNTTTNGNQENTNGSGNQGSQNQGSDGNQSQTT